MEGGRAEAREVDEIAQLFDDDHLAVALEHAFRFAEERRPLLGLAQFVGG